MLIDKGKRGNVNYEKLNRTFNFTVCVASVCDFADCLDDKRSDKKMKTNNKIELPDINSNYFFLYEKVVEENKKLRERFDYPKIEFSEYFQPFGKKRLIMNFPLSDYSMFNAILDVDAVLCEKDNSYREYIINNLLRELGYKFFKRAYDYWKEKGVECEDE